MASTRKSRSVNKRYAKVIEESPEKDGGHGSKNKRKRKLSDMLRSQWSKDELECFYEAYRKYGKDWKKASHGGVENEAIGTVCKKSLYSRAYFKRCKVKLRRGRCGKNDHSARSFSFGHTAICDKRPKDASNNSYAFYS